MIYSHSRLSTFENCKQAFKLRYIDKIDLGIESIEAFMGSRVHNTLEYLYNKVKMGVIPDMGEILKYYLEDWNKSIHDNIKIVKDQFTLDDYKKLGEKCVIDYYSQNHPFKERVIENEKGVIIDIEGIKIRGFIDRLDWNGETIEIHDYKTGGTLPSQDKIDDDRQLALYQIAVQDLFPQAKEYKLIWHYLVFGKKLVSTRTQKDLDNLKDKIKKLVQEIENEKEYLPTVSRLCDWCEYKGICPAWNNTPSEEKNFKQEEGKQLVTRYVELSKKLSLEKKELDVIKKDILLYSKQQGTTLILDDNYRLKITDVKRLSLPKNSKIENELINTLKDMEIYDKVTGINMTALLEILEELSIEEQKRLRPLLQQDISKRINVTKINEQS